MTKNRCRWLLPAAETILALIAGLLLLVTPGALAQIGGTAESFVIDLNHPYVYLKFDHFGAGIPRNRNEPTSRIWLRLVNNCRVPIIVSTFGVPDGSPKGEAGVMDTVVPVVVSGATGSGTVPLEPLPPPLGSASPEQKPSTDAKADEMPEGYMFEVGSSESIPPGKNILFSVPTNHLGKRWHFEIPFRFDLPEHKGRFDESIGGEAQMVITYSVWDLSSKYRTGFEQK
jgi:hypothetical protein